MSMFRTVMMMCALSTLWLNATPLMAQEATTASSSLDITLDAEIDPLAYILSGHSVHVGLWLGHVRVDLGAFGLDVPKAFHQQDGFEQRFDGFGAKVDYVFGRDRFGGFVGLEASLNGVTVTSTQTKQVQRERVVQAGVRAGWRFELYKGLYIAPWIGLGRQLGPDSIAFGASTFKMNPWTIFPTIHIGYLPLGS